MIHFNLKYSVLQLCHRQLSEDLTDKHHAISIDSDCARLSNKTETLSMHQDPTRIKKGYAMRALVCPLNLISYDFTGL